MFLGPCEVCGQVSRTYRSLSLHLRGKDLDEGHLTLKAKYRAWRSEYRAVRCCWRCKATWEIKDKSLRDTKLCQTCSGLREQVGKRQYAKMAAPPAHDPRQRIRGRKAQWDGTPSREVLWRKDDDLYKEVVSSCLGGEKVVVTMRRLGVSYTTYRAILQDALGVDGYARIAASRKSSRSAANIKGAHQKWQQMTPEQKASEAQRRFGRGSALEASFARQLEILGLDLVLNVWQSVKIAGVWRPREADIKVTLRDGRKIVILCDGEAFHGPRYIYAKVDERVEDDIATAEGYYDLGYTALRYSETEILSGVAFQHFCSLLQRLTESSKILRLWHPAVERSA